MTSEEIIKKNITMSLDELEERIEKARYTLSKYPIGIARLSVQNVVYAANSLSKDMAPMENL